MTIMSACCCERDLECECSLQEAIKALLEAADEFLDVSLYTGGLVASADLGGSKGPALPYGVLSVLGANNSQQIGDSCYQYRVLVRFRLFTRTEKSGLELAMAASDVLRAGGCFCTLEGRAQLWGVPPWPSAGKVEHGVWMTQTNLPLLVRSHQLV